MSRTKDTFCPACGINERWNTYLIGRIEELEKEIEKANWMLNEVIADPICEELGIRFKRALEARYEQTHPEESV